MVKKSTVVQATRRRPTPALDKYLTVGEAADMLGWSARHLRNEINAGRVPAYRLGPRSTRIKLSDLEAVLKPVVDGQ